jgi:tetratricopeptide (TPR) repeat protein
MRIAGRVVRIFVLEKEQSDRNNDSRPLCSLMTIRNYYLAVLVGLTLITQRSVAAESRSRTEHPDMTIAKLTEAIRLHPGDANLYNSRGRAYHDNREYDKAILDYTEAIRLKRTFSDAYYDRARAFAVGKGENDKAIKDFSEAIRLDPRFAAAYYRRLVPLASRQWDTGRRLHNRDAALT